MTITALQKYQRTQYIGASDAAAVLGLDKYRTPLDVWRAKGETPEPDDIDEDNLNIMLGNMMEPIIGKLAGGQIGRKVHRRNQTLFHPDFDFIAANLDYRVVGENVPLECKLTNDWTAFDEPLLAHIPQVTQQMAVMNAPYAYIAYLIDGRGRKFKIHRIERDDVAINGLIEQLCDFWYGHVLTGIPPEPRTADDLKLLYPHHFPKETVELPAELLEKANLLATTKGQIKILEKNQEELEILIKRAIGRAEAGKIGKVPVATWKNNKDSIEFDLDAAIADLWAHDCAMPEERAMRIADIKQTYTRAKPGARVFRLQVK